MRLNERIRDERCRQDRKLTEVARTAGVDWAHLQRFEQGTRDMSGDKISRVLSALGLDVHGEPPGLVDGSGAQDVADVDTGVELGLEDVPSVSA